jgi:hypothetical protein
MLFIFINDNPARKNNYPKHFVMGCEVHIDNLGPKSAKEIIEIGQKSKE